MKKHQLIWIILMSALGISCSVKTVHETGFLNDYSMLKPLPDSPETRYFETDCALWKKYKKVIVEPVVIRFTEDATAKAEQINIPEVQELADFFHNEMLNVLKDQYQITTEPGPDTLRIRTAIVDVKSTDVLANVISKALFYVPVDLGEAAIEGELADSITGERYAAIVDRKIGSMLSVLGAYTEWGHTKTAFEDWAKQLSELLKAMLQRNTQAVLDYRIETPFVNSQDLIFKFTSQPTLSKHFALDNPARISLDFLGTRDGMSKKFNVVKQGSISSFVVAEDGCKTRIVIQLKKPANYQTFIEDNLLRVRIEPRR